MSLTDIEIRNSKPSVKIRKLTDGGGLQLWIFPDGAKRWRLEYRFGGKRKLLAIGVYPVVSLKEARGHQDQAKGLLKEGRDPSEVKKLAKIAAAVASANTFHAVAEELFQKKEREGRSEKTLTKFKWMWKKTHAIDNRVLAEITPIEVLHVIRKIETRGTLETAARVREFIGEVFRFGVATGRAPRDPTPDLKGALAVAPVRHRPAIIDPDGFGGLMRVVETYDGAIETKLALEFLALTFVRPGELRSAEWAEFDLEAAVWSIPATKMKMRKPHKVPLSKQSLAILARVHPLTGHSKFVFPSIRSPLRQMSENTLNGALRRMSFTSDEMTAHGFRASASSLLNESGLWHPDAIEAQLAHAEENEVRAAYMRAPFWDERMRMMTWWADKVDELRAGRKLASPLLSNAQKLPSIELPSGGVFD